MHSALYSRSIETRLSVFILFNDLVSGPFFYLPCAIQLDHLSVCLFCPGLSLLIDWQKEREWRACVRTLSCVFGDNSTGAIGCAQITAVLWLLCVGSEINITLRRRPLLTKELVEVILRMSLHSSPSMQWTGHLQVKRLFIKDFGWKHLRRPIFPLEQILASLFNGVHHPNPF